LRKGEILNLKWGQIRNGFIYLRETKTKNPRQIPVNEDLEKIFNRIKNEQNPTGDNVVTLDGKPVKSNRSNSEYVFTREGEYIKWVRTSFISAVKRAGIEDFRFHDLRHTFASQVLLRGGTLKDIQELLGHKTMTMTLRYAHLTQESKRKAVNFLNGMTDRTISRQQASNDDCHKTVTNSNPTSITARQY